MANEAAETGPAISIIVPTMPDLQEIEAVRCALAIHEPRVEVLHATGHNPPAQRNAAAGQARAPVLYFLDDDCVFDEIVLRRVLAHFEDPDVLGVCGPNVAPTGPARPAAEAADVVLGSFAGVAGKRSKWAAVGRLREASDSDFILCNFAIRRAPFADGGGFDHTLFPNEENELLDRIRAAGKTGRILYDPDLRVQRARPQSWREFAHKIAHYGSGRVDQMRVRFTGTCLANLLPAPGLLAGVGLLIAAAWRWWLAIPYVLYALAVLAISIGHTIRRRRLSLLWRLPLYFATVHLAYPLGQWRRLLTGRRRPPDEHDYPVRRIARPTPDPAE